MNHDILDDGLASSSKHLLPLKLRTRSIDISERIIFVSGSLILMAILCLSFVDFREGKLDTQKTMVWLVFALITSSSILHAWLWRKASIKIDKGESKKSPENPLILLLAFVVFLQGMGEIIGGVGLFGFNNASAGVFIVLLGILHWYYLWATLVQWYKLTKRIEALSIEEQKKLYQ